MGDVSSLNIIKDRRASLDSQDFVPCAIQVKRDRDSEKEFPLTMILTVVIGVVIALVIILVLWMFGIFGSKKPNGLPLPVPAAISGTNKQDSFCEESHSECNVWVGCRMIVGILNLFSWPGKIWTAVKFLWNPSWQKLAEGCECSDLKERELRLVPSYQDCVDHRATIAQKWMGLSCCFFGFTPLVYFWHLGTATNPTGTIVGGVLSGILFYVSSVSFLADYWYTGDTPAEIKDGCSEHQKQAIFNYIDRTNVPLIALIECSIGLIQAILNPAQAGLIASLACSFFTGAYVQYMSLTQIKTFTDIAYQEDYDRKNPCPKATNHLKWMLYYCLLWHILAAIPPFVQIYMLLKM